MHSSAWYTVPSLEYPWTSATRQSLWFSYPHILHNTVAQYPKWISVVDGRENDCLKSKVDLNFSGFSTEMYREFAFVCASWIGCVPGRLGPGFHGHVRDRWRQQGTKELWRVDYTACARSGLPVSTWQGTRELWKSWWGRILFHLT